jgi:predicted TIM-barrel fold metal-dependent hydrolase
MQIIDSQVHLWEAHRADRPWPPEQIGKPFVAAKNAVPHRQEPLSAEEFLGVMDATGVARAIIVPPSPLGDSNATALDAAARYPSRFAVMGRLDPTRPDALAQLEHWREQPNMLGIRMTFHRPQWHTWLQDPQFDPFWSTCARLQIPLSFLAFGLLPQVGDLARRHPDLSITIDHLGRTSGLFDDACFADLAILLDLAQFPGIAVKMTSLPCYTTEPYPYANLKPYLRRVFDAFGPQRLMWGSDYTRLPSTYRECLDHVNSTLDFLNQEDKQWIMGKTASTIMRWS